MNGKSKNQSLTASIVISYFSKNHLWPHELPVLVGSVLEALTGLTREPHSLTSAHQNPATLHRRSITPEYIVCLICGKKLKSLKLHIRAIHQIRVGEYKKMWSLPAEYPMVSSEYSSRRSALARQNGLGHKPKTVGNAPL
jgi:predicted transcriptional regulator